MPVTFTSDSDCITVTTAGRVTGVSPGRAVITARTADGRHTATCYIEVSENMLVHSGDYTVDRDTETVLVPCGTTAEALLPAFRNSNGTVRLEDASAPPSRRVRSAPACSFCWSTASARKPTA